MNRKKGKRPSEEEVAVKRMFAEMKRADERIRRNQEEIDRLRIETRAILASLKKPYGKTASEA